MFYLQIENSLSHPGRTTLATFFEKFRSGLSKTRTNLSDGLSKVFSGKTRLDEDILEFLEERLIAADLGVNTTMELIERLRANISLRERGDLETVIATIKSDLLAQLTELRNGHSGELKNRPHVIMVTGVNGAGKTTSIGKLASLYRNQGKSVLVGAADTFRAAASQQLEIWAERAGVDVVRNKAGADSAAVAYDAVAAAQNRGVDIALIDTAGRLHTSTNLMEELKKIKRVIGKRIPDAPHEVYLVLDATTGQNGLVQARLFNEAVGVTGIILAKLDGTARGGIVVAIQRELGVPVLYVGVGEQIDDLQPFDPEAYVEALFA